MFVLWIVKESLEWTDDNYDVDASHIVTQKCDVKHNDIWSVF